MAEFMVTIDTSGVDDLLEPDRAEVIRRERAAGRSLTLPIFPYARFEVRALATHPLVAKTAERPD